MKTLGTRDEEFAMRLYYVFMSMLLLAISSTSCCVTSGNEPLSRLITVNGDVHRTATRFYDISGELGKSIRHYQLPGASDASAWEYVQEVDPLIQDSPPEFEGWQFQGKKVGVWISHWSNGKVASIGAYKNGREEGTWIGWDEDGEISFVSHYKRGMRDGIELVWHHNGQLAERWNFKEGEPVGRMQSWDEAGHLDQDAAVDGD